MRLNSFGQHSATRDTRRLGQNRRSDETRRDESPLSFTQRGKSRNQMRVLGNCIKGSNMTMLRGLWDRAKTGVKLGIGPVALTIRASRRAKVASNGRRRRRALMDARSDHRLWMLKRSKAIRP